ncbi:MAG: hypothetical protein F2836_05015, partial [Actinobacteria bacterium]|nr:hypothetical protein [Actinomycetota bacterium]
MTIPILVTRRPQGQRIGLAIATVVSIALLWILPPVGFVACAVMLVIAPPWGRSITERGLISLLLALGVIAIAFPRASSVPVTPFSAHLTLSLLTAIAVGLGLFGRGRKTRVPKLRLPD